MAQLAWSELAQAPTSAAEFGDALNQLQRGSAQQRDALQQTFDQFQKQLDEQAAIYRDKLANLHDSHASFDLNIAWQKDRRQRQREFEDQIAAQLGLEQAPSWTEVTRSWRRARVLHEMEPARITGSSADLIAILKKLDLNEQEQTALEGLRNDYAEQIDEGLRAWEQRYDDLLMEMFACTRLAGQGDQRAADQWQAKCKERASLVKRIADVNESSTPLFAAKLNEKHRTQFMELEGAIEFPQLHQSGPVDAAAAYLIDCKEINAQRRELIAAMYQSYTLQRDQLRAGAIRKQHEWIKPAAVKKRADERARLEADGLNPRLAREAALAGSPVIPYLKGLFELERNTCAQMLGALSAEEVQALPVGIKLDLEW